MTMAALDAIDIIIPVYNAHDDLRRCVDSIFRTRDDTLPWRLTLIDDCSPDPRIVPYFAELAALGEPRLRLLRNEQNLGFVGTVNRGMALGREDVILLNSDTIVTRGWLRKISRCAASDAEIGTITPFSSNAEICSFPNFCRDNPLPSGYDEEDVNLAMEQAALPSYPDIPTAVGFCMYIRRALLDKIGLFDAETFGLGYGEENDFCMRAIEVGYRNVLCDDTYVRHVGSSSFDTKKADLARRNMQRLLEKHPDYQRRVADFIARDPLRPLRALALSTLHLQGTPGQRRGVLHILHGRQGGTATHVRQLAKGAKSALRHYVLETFGEEWVLEDLNGDTPVRFRFRHRQDEVWRDMLLDLCRRFRIDLCHVHHLAGCRDGLLQAFAGFPLSYGFTIHDFYLACPTINLLGHQGDYCGAQTDPDQCRACLAAQPDFAQIDIVAWREAHRDFVNGAAFLLAPSEWAGSVFRQYFPHAHEVTVVPHGEPELPAELPKTPIPVMLLPEDGRHRIGVLGAIGPVKGARRLEKLVARTQARGLPLCWVVIGYLDRQYQPFQSDTLIVHGRYEPWQMRTLLDHYDIALTVFPSAGPETFCYTLTEAWQAGRPALVPPIGALGQRVTATGAGWLMEDWQDEDRILDQVMALLQPDQVEMLQELSRTAAELPVFSEADMARATLAAYGDIALAAVDVPGMATERMLQAAREAERNRVESPRTVLERGLLKLAHLGLRLRYTLPGRWLYRVVPVRWQQALKQRLLE